METIEVFIMLLAMIIIMHGIFVSLELKWLRNEIKYIIRAITMLDSDLFVLMKPQKDGKNEDT